MQSSLLSCGRPCRASAVSQRLKESHRRRDSRHPSDYSSVSYISFLCVPRSNVSQRASKQLRLCCQFEPRTPSNDTVRQSPPRCENGSSSHRLCVIHKEMCSFNLLLLFIFFNTFQFCTKKLKEHSPPPQRKWSTGEIPSQNIGTKKLK